MRPSELGFPEKFIEYRPGQLEVAEEIASSSRRYSLLSAPPGAGKSLIYLTIARLLGQRKVGEWERTSQDPQGAVSPPRFRTLILVGTKQLQAQLVKDFAAMGLVEIKGAGNYECLAVRRGGELEDLGPIGGGWVSCDEGPCRDGVECDLKGDGCLYYDQQRTARASDFVVANFAYWLSMSAYSSPEQALGSFDLVVVDEAHGVHDWLTGFCAAEFTGADLGVVPDMPAFPSGPKRMSVEVWGRWAEKAGWLVDWELATLKNQMREVREQGGEVDRETLKEHRTLNGLSNRLAVARKAASDESTRWVVERQRGRGPRSDRWVISPVWCREFGPGLLFRSIPRCLLVSATLTHATADLLGIADGEYSWHEGGEGFSKERRPVIWVSHYQDQKFPRIQYNTGREDLDIYYDAMAELLLARGDRKGIIHSRSYQRAGQIGNALKMRGVDGLVVVEKGFDLRAARGRFGLKTRGTLISAGLEEGVDLPYDDCRFVIIAKTPFIDTRPPLMRARVEEDKSYGHALAMEAVIQMSGRGMRAADDACEIVVMDGHFGWFYKKVEWPRWFGVAIRVSRGLPEPMNLENPGVGERPRRPKMPRGWTPGLIRESINRGE